MGSKKSTLFTFMIYWIEIIMFTFDKWSLSVAWIKKAQAVRRENERNHNCSFCGATDTPSLDLW